MIRRPPRSTLDRSSAASDVYKRQAEHDAGGIGYKVFAGIMLGIAFHFLNGLFSHLGLLNTWPPMLSVSIPSIAAFVLAPFREAEAAPALEGADEPAEGLRRSEAQLRAAVEALGEGLVITDLSATGASPSYFAFAAFPEINVTTGGGDLTMQTGGFGLNRVTKRGTNQFHGTGFWFLRNDAMDAKNFFDQEKPDFSRNQYGGTVGGPVLRDRLFFFGSYELLTACREASGLPAVAKDFVVDVRQLEAARAAAYGLIDQIVLPHQFYRTDIGEQFANTDAARLKEWGWLQ